MKTSWNEIALIERYLDDKLSAEEAIVFENRLTSDPAFRIYVTAQTEVRMLARKHHLIRLRNEARRMHYRFYNDPARRPLRLAIEALFKS